MLEITNVHVYLALSRLPGLGPWRLKSLLRYFKNPLDIIGAKSEKLVQFGLTQEQCTLINKINWSTIRDLEKEWIQNPQQSILTWDQPSYPPLLLEIPSPPPVLFCRGNITLLKDAQIALVGSRKPSPYGLKLAQKFATELIGKGLTITSGLALGIDGASHQGALLAKGKTIAVLGSGLNHIYPFQHKRLAERIVAEEGLLIAEFEPAAPPMAKHFPQRNRIISGLALGVLVVEATVRSGSLITARLAVEYGREVFALPGAIDHQLAHGCNFLIQQGAKLVNNTKDIIDEIFHFLPHSGNQGSLQDIEGNAKVFSSNYKDSKITLDQELDFEQRQLLSCMKFCVTPIESLVEETGYSVQTILILLTSLELKHYVESVSGGFIRLK